MRLKLPTIDIRMRDVDVPTPDVNGMRSDLPDLDLRGRASDLRGAAAAGASTLRDLASQGASDLRDRASDMKLPDVKLPDVKLPNVEMPAIDVGKAVAPAAKAVGEGIDAVAESFRSIGRGINDWRNPPRQQPPLAEAGIALLAGVGGGMALMYFLDPKQGRRRRTLLAAKLNSWTRVAGQAFQGATRDLANRSQAISAGIGSMGGGAESLTEADAQMAVIGGPDASSDLQEIDRAAAAGRYADETLPGSGETPIGSSQEIYGQAWGEGSGTSQETGSFGEGVTGEEDRDRIRSTSE
ncbi:MAG: hypothetical protein H0W07_05930 [Chloroflexi bacterium]|nr:hypothetical protein [Chloroflexota bacterium]